MSKKTPEQLEAARIRNKRWEEKHPDARKNYRKAHREEIKAKDAAYYAAHRETIAVQTAAYRAAHREERIAKDHAYLEANKEAINQRRRERYRANSEKIAERNKRSYQKYREQKQATNRKWTEEHPEETRIIKGRYKRAHREKVLEQSRIYTKNRRKDPAVLLREKAWRKAHPEYARAAAKRRRALKKGALVNDFTAAQWQAMKEHYQHRCAYCGRKMKRLTQDHLTPLSKDGSHTANNIVPACLSCNSKKSAGNVLVPVQPLLLL